MIYLITTRLVDRWRGFSVVELMFDSIKDANMQPNLPNLRSLWCTRYVKD